jgi:hypothetical protein
VRVASSEADDATRRGEREEKTKKRFAPGAEEDSSNGSLFVSFASVQKSS